MSRVTHNPQRVKLALGLLLVPAIAMADLAADIEAGQVRPLRSAIGGCAVSVPTGWSGEQAAATSPDNRNTVKVTRPEHVESFEQLKAMAKKAYAKERYVTHDTASEMELEARSPTDKTKWIVYRAISTPDHTICVAELTYASMTVVDARTLVRTLAAKSVRAR